MKTMLIMLALIFPTAASASVPSKQGVRKAVQHAAKERHIEICGEPSAVCTASEHARGASLAEIDERELRCFHEGSSFGCTFAANPADSTKEPCGIARPASEHLCLHESRTEYAVTVRYSSARYVVGTFRRQ